MYPNLTSNQLLVFKTMRERNNERNFKTMRVNIGLMIAFYNINNRDTHVVSSALVCDV